MTAQKQVIVGIFLGVAFLAFAAGYTEPAMYMAIMTVMLCADGKE